MLDPLNPTQQAAVHYSGRHLLIVAGPGTGKTHTITYRIASLRKTLCDNQKILALTFTNKASREMRERLEYLMNEQMLTQGIPLDESVMVGTFHRFCHYLLQTLNSLNNNAMFSRGDGARSSVLAMPDDISEMVKSLWPKRTGSRRSELLNKISYWKSVKAVDQSVDPEQDSIFKEVLAYDQAMMARGWFDYDDILLECWRMLSRDRQKLTEAQSAYPYIFVDEYQDINAVQHALLKLLVGNCGSITVIGDPRQAIYGFRGSDVKYFNSFVADFPGAHTVYLKQNYRSSENLIKASSQVMTSAQEQQGIKVPELVAEMFRQGQLTVHAAASDKAEAEFVVHQIEQLVGGTSMFSQDSGRVQVSDAATLSFGDVAVLFRLNSQVRALIAAFERSGIPYHFSGKKVVLADEKDSPLKGAAAGAEGSLVDDVCPHQCEELTFVAEKVSLMTLHASKGLEFPFVFIVGCEDGMIPLNIDNMDSDVEEERRVFYVGMTRAKEQLCLVHAKRRYLYGKSYKLKPSRFLFDIEESLKQYVKNPSNRKRPISREKQLNLFKM